MHLCWGKVYVDQMVQCLNDRLREHNCSLNVILSVTPASIAADARVAPCLNSQLREQEEEARKIVKMTLSMKEGESYINELSMALTVK